MNELEAAIDEEANEYIAIVIDAVKRAEAEGFTAVATDAEIMAVSSAAYWESYYAMGPQVRPGVPRLFKPHLHPYLATLGTLRSYHAGSAETWDFLRHEFTAEGQRVVVVDGVNDALVRLPGRGAALMPLTPDARAAELARVAALLFAEPWSSAAWLPRGSAGETGGMAFTTSHDVSPLTARAVMVRMDAGVWNGDLCFLYYKLHNFEQGIRTNSPRSWFDPHAG